MFAAKLPDNTEGLLLCFCRETGTVSVFRDNLFHIAVTFFYAETSTSGDSQTGPGDNVARPLTSLCNRASSWKKERCQVRSVNALQCAAHAPRVAGKEPQAAAFENFRSFERLYLHEESTCEHETNADLLGVSRGLHLR